MGRQFSIKKTTRVRVTALAILTMILSGCGADSYSDELQLEATPVGDVPTSTAPVLQASAEEQAAFDEMFAEAISDGLVSANELEQFALEAVQCTVRAGYESALLDFDPRTGAASFATSGDQPDPGPEEAASDACQDTYYWPAFLEFTKTSGPSEEEQ